MQIKAKSGRALIMPTPEEDAQITASALTDPDNLPLTDAELKQFKRGRGKAAGERKKEQVILRDYCASIESNRDSTRLDSVRR